MSNHNACVNGEIRKFYEVIILFRVMMESERNRESAKEKLMIIWPYINKFSYLPFY